MPLQQRNKLFLKTHSSVLNVTEKSLGIERQLASLAQSVSGFRVTFVTRLLAATYRCEKKLKCPRPVSSRYKTKRLRPVNQCGSVILSTPVTRPTPNCRQLLSGLRLLFLLLTTLGAAAKPKRVLVVHSFGSAAPPFTITSTAFETALKEEMGEGVDLDEVSLDVARYAASDIQEALVGGN